jgi:hypothetical protein
MHKSKKFLQSLSSQEKNVLIDLLKENAVLSFNEKGMVQIFTPEEGLKFIDMGDDIIRSLERKGLIAIIENKTWEVREFRLSSEGMKIAKNLSG